MLAAATLAAESKAALAAALPLAEASFTATSAAAKAQATGDAAAWVRASLISALFNFALRPLQILLNAFVPAGAVGGKSMGMVKMVLTLAALIGASAGGYYQITSGGGAPSQPGKLDGLYLAETRWRLRPSPFS